MSADPYKPDEQEDIRAFINERKGTILDRIRSGGALLQDCTVDRFISIILPLVPAGTKQAKALNDYRINHNDACKQYLATCLQKLKNEETPASSSASSPPSSSTSVGVLADGRAGRKADVMEMFPSLLEATAADAAHYDRVDERPLCCTDCSGSFYHKTVDGAGGSRRTGGAASKVSLFYEKRGTDYYLVAWGVHDGMDSGGRNAVYRVMETAPGCALRPRRSILRPPGK